MSASPALASDPSLAALKPALFTVSLIGRPSKEPEGSVPLLRAVWDACGRMGMTQPIGDTPVGWPDDLPPVALDDHLEVLARRGRGQGQAVYEAVLFAKHDVLGVLAALAPNREGDTVAQWADLADEWASASPSGDGSSTLLGEIHVFTALSAVPVASLPGLGGAVAAAVPGRPQGSMPSPALAADGFAVWGETLLASPRRVAVVATADREADLDGWLWYAGDELPRLTAYLVEAAKVRYEFAVYQQLAELSRASRDRVDRQSQTVLDLHQEMELGSPVPIDTLFEAQLRLSQVQADAAGLLVAKTRLIELQRAAAIARANMRALRPPPPSGDAVAPDSIFERDDERASWLSAQLEHEVVFAEAARERGSEVHQLTMLRLQQVGEHRARLRENLMLLQTSILGGVGAVFVALNTLGHLSASVPLRASLVILVAVLALTLPPLFVRWYDGFGWSHRIFGALLGAALGGVIAGSLLSASSPAWLRWARWPLAAVAVVGLAFLAETALAAAQARTTRFERHSSAYHAPDARGRG